MAILVPVPKLWVIQTYQFVFKPRNGSECLPTRTHWCSADGDRRRFPRSNRMLLRQRCPSEHCIERHQRRCAFGSEFSTEKDWTLIKRRRLLACVIKIADRKPTSHSTTPKQEYFMQTKWKNNSGTEWVEWGPGENGVRS